MVKTVILFVLLVLVFSLEGAWHNVTETNIERFSCIQSEQGVTEIIFNLDGYNMEQIERSGGEYQKITHSEEGRLLETGMPDLPQFTTIIAIPRSGEVEVEYETLSSEIWHDIAVYPCEELIDEYEETQDKFTINSEYYNRGSLFPEENVFVARPAIMRDLRVIAVSFCPFTYNAETRELEIISEIRAEIRVTGEGGENSFAGYRGISRAYEPLYESMVINYTDFIGRPIYQQPTLLFIIQDMADALETLEYLKDWKRQKGFDVVVATTSETGTSTTSIKAYLQEAYDYWENPPEYVCFCGDANGSYAIPTWGIGDHPYAELAGNDLLEDIIIGRLSFQSNATFQVLVSKILSYEKEPYMNDTEWYSQAVLAGDPGISGPSMVFTCQTVKELMLDYPDNYDDDNNFTEIYSGSFPSSINSAINNGVSYMVYRGWMGMSGWGPGSQTNGFMMPFATLLTCGTGSWASGNSDSEEFMQMGSVTNPSGAIGAVGTATAGTHSCFNNSLTIGIYGAIFRDRIFSMGGATTRGKQYLYETFPQDPGGYVESYFNWTNLMGDPSLMVWTDVPEQLNVIYDANPPLGGNFLSITVRDASNAPLPGAWVTLTNESESFFSTEFCSDSGEALIDLNGSAEGEYDLVVSYHDFIPHQGVVEIEQVQQYVDIASVNYDDAAGNGDGLLNPGETITIIPSLTNFGSQAVSNVNVSCALTHNFMSLNTTNLVYGDISAGETVIPVSGIELEISPAALDGMQGVLELTVTDGSGNTWSNWHYLNIDGANLYAVEYEVVGAEILEPGVTSELYFTLENLGSVSAENLAAELVCLNPRLIILDSLGTFGTISPGTSGNNSSDTFQVTPSVTIIPGTQLALEIHLSNPAGYYQICQIIIPVGEVEITDPLGPDEYGYWCYDDEDLGYENCPVFDWIEIDPDLGGNGTIIPLSDSGDTGDLELIDLPDGFTFSFYGMQYNEITICSNGWLAPGEHEGANFMNHPLPGPEGPSPMIAAFWDDLNVNSGNVCYYFDDQEHLLVFEWSECRNGDTNSDETFQIIIYDPNFYQTMTDDSLIKMQYLEINNDNAGSYPSNHGQFCTIGLESENAETGMTYTFNDNYPASCKELENEMAILFSPPQYPEFGPYLEMVAYDYLAGDDEFIEAGETVNLSLTVGNQGAEEATAVEVEMIINDPWFTIIDGEALIEEIPALGTIELIDEFSFEVSDEVPDDYPFNVTINMTTADDFWFTSFSLTAHWTNAFYVDQDSIDVLLGLNLTTERTFTLTNTSAQIVNYYLRMDDEQTAGRDISGSYVTCDSTVFHPGSVAVWHFAAYNNSTSNEWVKNIWLTFPPGVTVNSASQAYGASGGVMMWDGTTGEGVTVNWNGEAPNGSGYLRCGETATWLVHVEIGENFASDIQVGWEMEGDGYGSPPHTDSGEINFNYPIQWINLNTSYGTLAAGASDEITIYYDTNDIEMGEYDCSISILSESWFSKNVNTHLTVVAVNEDNNDLQSVTDLLGNFPNPFNPSTEIRFNLAEDSRIDLNIYNIRGQKVRTLLAEQLSAGNHKINWNGRNDQDAPVSSGIYYLCLKTGSENLTQKLLLLK